jgi:hypothetical protein
MEIDLKCRKCLQTIRELAFDMATNSENEFWITAYAELAMAADKLDAMEARSTVIQGEGRPLEIGKESGWSSLQGYTMEPEREDSCSDGCGKTMD